MMPPKVSEPQANSVGISIGHLALKRGMLTPEQLRDALIEQSRSNEQLTAILVARGFMTREQIDRLVRETTASPVTLPEAPFSSEPTAIGKYRIVREAGRGAMAKVYEAVDAELQRKVALKVLLASPSAHAEEAALEEDR